MVATDRFSFPANAVGKHSNRKSCFGHKQKDTSSVG